MSPSISVIQTVLEQGLQKSLRNHQGEAADYIPELALVPLETTSAAVTSLDGACVTAGEADSHLFTFQSSAKVLLLAGLLEERGPVEVFATVGSEPSGQDFASLARLETHGPLPANPLVNAGAIALCGQLRGSAEQRIAWIQRWAEKLYGTRLEIDEKVLVSESRTANRNRAIAYLLTHNRVLTSDVETTLAAYFALCSLRGSVKEASRLPAVLANGGVIPGSTQRVLSYSTVAIVVSLMATCGMYNESGNYLVATGMPAKSGVSGVIIAVVPGVAGIAVSSPRLNEKGGSVRGHIILRHLSRNLGWHFAIANQPPAGMHEPSSAFPAAEPHEE